MTQITYTERLTGFVTFGETDYNEGLRRGREDGTTCAFEVEIEIADVESFLDDPEHQADARGTFECGALGGTLAIEDGFFNLFVQEGEDSRVRRMHYRLFVRDRDGRALTVLGFKDVADDFGFDVWTDTSTLFTRIVPGHVEVGGDEPVPIAAGILTISHPAFLRMLASMRARGGRPWRRAATVLRFQWSFVGTLAHVYGGRQRRSERNDFPDAAHALGDPLRGHASGDWHDVPEQPGLRRRIFHLRAGDGLALTLHNLRRDVDATSPPVLCLHGVGVRGDIFVGAPGSGSVARTLIDAGYDVWILNWRASIDLPPRPYTLDQAAAFDHPAAIAEVKRLTGAGTIRVLAHCQGSTSFTMAALSGLTDGDVTHVVSSAVSLHTVVPWTTVMKGRFILPLVGLRFSYISAQWGVRAPTFPSRCFARWAGIVRRECDNPVCALGNYMYGTGGDVLWTHDKLGHRTHDWVAREFGFASYTFLRQMYKCTKKKHLVPVDAIESIQRDLVAAPIPDQRWTFFAGTKNRLYLPDGQQLTHKHFEEKTGNTGRHSLHLVPDYGHLDPLIGADAEADVYPLIVAGFAD